MKDKFLRCEFHWKSYYLNNGRHYNLYKFQRLMKDIINESYIESKRDSIQKKLWEKLISESPKFDN